jgi:Flp pilus assembly protein TadD
MTLLWTGHPAEAVTSLERASTRKPDDYQIRGNLGDAYKARGDAQKAGEAYSRSVVLARAQLALNPNDAAAMSYAATGLAKTGHPAEAKRLMREALALDQKDPNILSDAAVVAALAGRDAEALTLLRRAADAGYCREIIGRQPEFAGLQPNAEFRSIVNAPKKTS